MNTISFYPNLSNLISKFIQYVCSTKSKKKTLSTCIIDSFLINWIILDESDSAYLTGKKNCSTALLLHKEKERKKLLGAIDSLYPCFTKEIQVLFKRIKKPMLRVCYLMKIGLNGPQAANLPTIRLPPLRTARHRQQPRLCRPHIRPPHHKGRGPLL